MTDTIQVRDIRQTGFWWADNEIMDIYAPRLGAYALAVYCLLARAANNRTGQSTLSLRQLERGLKLSKHTVIKALATLESERLIRKMYKVGPGGHDRNVYTLADVKALVHHMHQGSAYHTPGVVHQMHQGSAPRAQDSQDSSQDSISTHTPVCDSQSLIQAMHSAIPDKIRPAQISTTKSETAAALALEQAGVTAEQVATYVTAQYADNPYFKAGDNGAPVVMTMATVSRRIRAWLAKQTTPAAPRPRSDCELCGGSGAIEYVQAPGREPERRRPGLIPPGATTFYIECDCLKGASNA